MSDSLAVELLRVHLRVMKEADARMGVMHPSPIRKAIASVLDELDAALAEIARLKESRPQ